MLDYLPHVDLQKPESIGDQISSYLGATLTPDKDGNLTDFNNGSATCVSSNKRLVGEAETMVSGHRRTFELGYDNLQSEEILAPENLTKASSNDVSRHISPSRTSKDPTTSIGWHKQVAAYFPKLAPCLGTSHRH
jgi:hypothetical protein